MHNTYNINCLRNHKTEFSLLFTVNVFEDYNVFNENMFPWFLHTLIPQNTNFQPVQLPNHSIHAAIDKDSL